MAEGYKRMFWGIIIVNISITIGILPIFPTFVGWLVVLSGFEKFAASYRKKDLSSIKYCLIALAFLTFTEDAFTMFSANNTVIFPLIFYPIILKIIELIAFHKIMEGTIQHFYEMNREEKANVYTGKDKTYLLLYGIALVLLTVAIMFNHPTLLVVGTMTNLVVFVYLLVAFYSLRHEDFNLKV